jgi:branched-chain amino acid aminotransferase
VGLDLTVRESIYLILFPCIINSLGAGLLATKNLCYFHFMSELVSVNGKISKPEEAQISVFDRGFLFGDGVYEVVRSYGRILFAVEDHIDRLINSALRIDLKIGLSKEEIIKELYRIYNHADQDDMYVRLVITRGQSQRINIDPSQPLKPNIVVYLKDIEKSDPKFHTDGVDIVTASVYRNSKKSLDPNIKSGNYLNNIMAIGEAKKKNVYDAVMTNSEGQITEGPTWNIFMVKDGRIIGPPDQSDILHGITRKILKAICLKNSLKWEEKNFTVSEFKMADEGFSTGSVKEVLAIRSLDGVKIGTGKPGPMTQKLALLYKEYVKKYCDERKK